MNPIQGKAALLFPAFMVIVAVAIIGFAAYTLSAVMQEEFEEPPEPLPGPLVDGYSIGGGLVLKDGRAITLEDVSPGSMYGTRGSSALPSTQSPIGDDQIMLSGGQSLAVGEDGNGLGLVGDSLGWRPVNIGDATDQGPVVIDQADVSATGFVANFGSNDWMWIRGSVIESGVLNPLWSFIITGKIEQTNAGTADGTLTVDLANYIPAGWERMPSATESAATSIAGMVTDAAKISRQISAQSDDGTWTSLNTLKCNFHQTAGGTNVSWVNFSVTGIIQLTTV